MFDPTAFENMKVVIEGSIYDLDLMGEIRICDRNDIINMAKMSRCFSLTFRLPEAGDYPASAKFEMEAGLVNLASELIPGANDDLSGSHIFLEFVQELPWDYQDFHAIELLFKDLWGSSRKINQMVRFDPFTKEIKTVVVSIDFERIIREEQMDDLVAMIDVMVATLKKMDQL